MSRRLSRTRRFIASDTLRALSVCGIIVVTFTTRPARPLQLSSTPQIPHTRSAQIEPRRIGSVILAESGPTGQSFITVSFGGCGEAAETRFIAFEHSIRRANAQ